MEFDRRKILVLGTTSVILLLPILAVLYLAIGPIVSNLEQASSASVLYQRFQRLEDELPAYQTALAQAQAELGIQAKPDPNIPAELASASLQNTLQSLVSQAGSQVNSSDIGVPQTVQGLQILSVTLSFNLPQDRLAPFLASVDAQSPHLTVQSLDIRSVDNGGGTSPLAIEMRVAEFRDLL